MSNFDNASKVAVTNINEILTTIREVRGDKYASALEMLFNFSNFARFLSVTMQEEASPRLLDTLQKFFIKVLPDSANRLALLASPDGASDDVIRFTATDIVRDITRLLDRIEEAKDIAAKDSKN